MDRYDIHGKKLLELNEKLYFGDVGLRNLIAGGEREGDIEKIIENIIYQQLRRMGYTVSVGQLRAGEVDFVCTQSNKRIYVQVAYFIASPETEEREFGFLENIKDNYPQYVISITPLIKRSDRKGITHISLRECGCFKKQSRNQKVMSFRAKRRISSISSGCYRDPSLRSG